MCNSEYKIKVLLINTYILCYIKISIIIIIIKKKCISKMIINLFIVKFKITMKYPLVTNNKDWNYIQLHDFLSSKWKNKIFLWKNMISK